MFENLFTPTSINNQTYIPRQRLGSGQYSGVYLGYNMNDFYQTNPLAIKFMLHECSTQLRNKFIAEETAFLQSHSHPNFTKYVDHSLNNINPYLVMELLPQTLFTIIQQRTATQELIELYLTQIATILQELLDKNQTHGDLRTKNIGLKDHQLKIFDPLPGICRSKSCQDKTSLWYAPETYENIYTPSSDTYTLGKNIEHLLVGRLLQSPEQAYDYIEIYHDCELPPEFKKIHHAMTYSDPKHRATPQQLAQHIPPLIEKLQQKEYFFKKDLF